LHATSPAISTCPFSTLVSLLAFNSASICASWGYELCGFFLFRDRNGKEPYQLVSRSGQTVHCISVLRLCCNREARASMSILHMFSRIRPGFVAVLQSFSMVEVLCTKPAGKKIPVDLTVARR
jgi:hypothetical protein